MTTMKGGEQFRWEVLVPRLIHPVKVAIVEALLWIDRPLSSSELAKVIAEPGTQLSNVAYHVRTLAEVGALEPVSRRRVRGATETFYFFA